MILTSSWNYRHTAVGQCKCKNSMFQNNTTAVNLACTWGNLEKGVFARTGSVSPVQPEPTVWYGDPPLPVSPILHADPKRV